jgi:hypothetical protein
MIKVTLTFVPPGGGEAEYCLDMNVPEVPRPGDYITISRKDATASGTEDFIVRRSWWHFEYPDSKLSHSGDDTAVGKVTGITVECEFARGPFSSEEHKRGCDMYQHRHAEYGKHPAVKDFESTCY